MNLTGFVRLHWSFSMLWVQIAKMSSMNMIHSIGIRLLGAFWRSFLSNMAINKIIDASLALLGIIIDHYKHNIHDTEHKLQHRTEQLKTKCDEDTAQRILKKTDKIFMKYITRALLTTNKTTKRLKRLQNTNTHSKHTTTHNTTTHTKTRQTNKQTNKSQKPHKQPTTKSKTKQTTKNLC